MIYNLSALFVEPWGEYRPRAMELVEQIMIFRVSLQNDCVLRKTKSYY